MAARIQSKRAEPALLAWNRDLPPRDPIDRLLISAAGLETRLNQWLWNEQPDVAVLPGNAIRKSLTILKD